MLGELIADPDRFADESVQIGPPWIHAPQLTPSAAGLLRSKNRDAGQT
jgi:hypothetical protein